MTEAKFTSTDYYQIMDSFIKGLGADQTYTEEKNCQDKFSLLLDDYYYLNVNRTTTDPVATNNANEGYMFKISYIVSNNYRETFKYCYSFIL